MAEKLKLALVGPVYPYRGGIAQYTGQLQTALAGHCDVHVFSFKRLYPDWLYPGTSDKEPGAKGKTLPGVRYTIDIYSPLSLRRTADDIVRAGCTVAVLTWWTLIWQPGLAYLARRLRKKGVKVVLLCHNVADHDAHGLKQRVSKALLKQADAYITHATEAADTLRAVRPDAPVLQRPHPIYGQFPAPNEHLEQRGRLELLFFGLIRPYKGLDVLIKALAKLHDEEVYLTVAGEAWGELAVLQQNIAVSGAPNVELHLEYIPDAEAANYFARADVVVLPYRSATGSGVLTVAYHYGKPVLATRVGGLPDSVVDGKTGWLVEPESADALAEAIAHIHRADVPKMEHAIAAFCADNSWDAMAAYICTFCEKL